MSERGGEGRARRLPVVAEKETLRAALEDLRADGSTIAFVPTMGALHEGHLSLVDRARSLADRVVVSVFLNPIQFDSAADLERYPRDLDADLAQLAERGVDLVFNPSDQEMYPGGAPVVTVDPGPIADRLCGPHRPGHFRGVATVVTKLLVLVRPEVAVFGEKDYQQSVLVRRLVRDLDLPVWIDTAPTVRESDGLAMSSRNANLTPEERGQATSIYRGLRAAADRFAGGERSARGLEGLVLDTIESEDLMRVQYVEAVHPRTLERREAEVLAGDVIAVAAFCGDTRLIDNLRLGTAGDE